MDDPNDRTIGFQSTTSNERWAVTLTSCRNREHGALDSKFLYDLKLRKKLADILNMKLCLRQYEIGVCFCNLPECQVAYVHDS